MSARKLYLWLAAASGYIGIGLLLGYALSDQTRNAALWLGLLLVILAAVLVGMVISSRSSKTAGDDLVDERPASNSGNITDLPPSR